MTPASLQNESKALVPRQYCGFFFFFAQHVVRKNAKVWRELLVIGNCPNVMLDRDLLHCNQEQKLQLEIQIDLDLSFVFSFCHLVHS